MLLLPPTLYWFLRYNNLLNTAISKKKHRECKSMRLLKNMLKCNLMFNAPVYFCDARFIKMWFDEIFRSHSKLWAEYKYWRKLLKYIRNIWSRSDASLNHSKTHSVYLFSIFSNNLDRKKDFTNTTHDNIKVVVIISTSYHCLLTNHILF